jgi:hypothetical protein
MDEVAVVEKKNRAGLANGWLSLHQYIACPGAVRYLSHRNHQDSGRA